MADFFTPDLGWEVFGFALRIWVAWIVWTLAEGFAADAPARPNLPRHSTRERVWTYGRVALVSLALAAFLWFKYGTHQEHEDGDTDPLWGSASQTVTDFNATPAQRTRHTLPFFLVILSLAAHGTYSGRKRADLVAFYRKALIEAEGKRQ